MRTLIVSANMFSKAGGLESESLYLKDGMLRIPSYLPHRQLEANRQPWASAIGIEDLYR